MKKLICLCMLLAMLLTCAAAEAQNTLIVYFSVPENVELDGVDAVSGASVLMKNDIRYGNLQYVATLISEHTGGEMWRIETEHQYPLEHDALLDAAAEEQDAEARPALVGSIENIAQYDRIFLGYPNWWYDLPMPLYSFLESYDLSGKEIIPFTVHGGSGFSDTVATIAALQPNAAVSQEGFSISRNAVFDCENQVAEWLGGFAEDE